MSYPLRLLIALDQLANALLGGAPDETLSARAYRLSISGGPTWPRLAIDALFFWERAHCRQAWLEEKFRRQLPPGYEGQIKDL